MQQEPVFSQIVASKEEADAVALGIVKLIRLYKAGKVGSVTCEVDDTNDPPLYRVAIYETPILCDDMRAI